MIFSRVRISGGEIDAELSSTSVRENLYVGRSRAWNRYRRPFINPGNQYAGINESAARTAN